MAVLIIAIILTTEQLQAD